MCGQVGGGLSPPDFYESRRPMGRLIQTFLSPSMLASGRLAVVPIAFKINCNHHTTQIPADGAKKRCRTTRQVVLPLCRPGGNDQ